MLIEKEREEEEWQDEQIEYDEREDANEEWEYELWNKIKDELFKSGELYQEEN